jgi:hypothetical protein
LEKSVYQAEQQASEVDVPEGEHIQGREDRDQAD